MCAKIHETLTVRTKCANCLCEERERDGLGFFGYGYERFSLKANQNKKHILHCICTVYVFLSKLAKQLWNQTY